MTPERDRKQRFWARARSTGVTRADARAVIGETFLSPYTDLYEWLDGRYYQKYHGPAYCSRVARDAQNRSTDLRVVNAVSSHPIGPGLGPPGCFS